MLAKETASELCEMVSNQVPWYYIAFAFLVAAALLAHGNSMVWSGWEKELRLPRWFSIVGDVFGVVLSLCLGCFIGHIVWNWALGGAVSLVGALSSTLIVSLIKARLGLDQTNEKTKDNHRHHKSKGNK